MAVWFAWVCSAWPSGDGAPEDEFEGVCADLVWANAGLAVTAAAAARSTILRFMRGNSIMRCADAARAETQAARIAAQITKRTAFVIGLISAA
jgi:hypothetical protein